MPAHFFRALSYSPAAQTKEKEPLTDSLARASSRGVDKLGFLVHTYIRSSKAALRSCRGATTPKAWEEMRPWCWRSEERIEFGRADIPTLDTLSVANENLHLVVGVVASQWLGRGAIPRSSCKRICKPENLQQKLL